MMQVPVSSKEAFMKVLRPSQAISFCILFLISLNPLVSGSILNSQVLLSSYTRIFFIVPPPCTLTTNLSWVSIPSGFRYVPSVCLCFLPDLIDSELKDILLSRVERPTFTPAAKLKVSSHSCLCPLFQFNF